MPFEWSEDLSVGIDQIDEQHKELIYRVNNLMEAIKEGSGTSETERIIAFLEKYIFYHFEDEEMYMTSIDYPGIAEQKEAHKEFKLIVKNVRDSINEHGITPSTMVTVQNKVCNWIINHVTNMDKQISRYNKENEK
jgi:hemerythrin